MRIHKNLYVAILFLVVSFICMLFLTTASPLYSVNPSPDGNTMFTVGKGLLHGLMPYKDVFDQRGPLIYLMNSVAALISYRTFFGIYIFESIAMFLDLFFIFKILNLKYSKKISIVSAFTVIPLIFNSKLLTYGDLPEEYVLPFIFITIYMLTRKLPENWGKHEYIVMGLFMSISFWIKYTLSITWIAIYLVLIIYFVYRKLWKKMFKSILYGVVGFLPVTLFIIILYTCKHALYDLFYVYFYLNITLYGHIGISPLIKYFIILFVLSICFFLSYIKVFDLSVLSIYMLLCVVVSNYIVLLKISSFVYYIEVFAFVFMLIPIIICKLLSKYIRLLYIVPLFALLGMFITNSSYLSYTQFFHNNILYVDSRRQSELPVMKEFASIVRKSKFKTVLTYGELDQGIYTYSGLLPSNKYFIKNNMKYKIMEKSQRYTLDNRKDQFIFIAYGYKNDTNKLSSGYILSKSDKYVLHHDYKIRYVKYALDIDNNFTKYVLYERKD